MRTFFPVLLFLFSLFGVIFPAKGLEELRVGDASCGISPEPLRFALLMLNAREPEIRIDLTRCEAKKGLQMLEAGKLDILLIETKAIPKTWKGEKTFYGAQALVCYVTVGNPVVTLTQEQLKEIWQAKEPTWAPYTGDSWNIQRIGIDPFQDNGLENLFLPPGRDEPKIFRVRDVAIGFPFLNDASLFCGAYLPERSAKYPAVPIDGIDPEISSILSGKYPLALRFEMLWKKPAKKSVGLFWEIWQQEACYRAARDAGLILAAPTNKKE